MKKKIWFLFLLTFFLWISITSVEIKYIHTYLLQVSSNRYGHSYISIIRVEIFIMVILIVLLLIAKYFRRIYLGDYISKFRFHLFETIYETKLSGCSEAEREQYVQMVTKDVDYIEKNYYTKLFDFMFELMKLFMVLICVSFVDVSDSVTLFIFLVVSCYQFKFIHRHMAKSREHLKQEEEKSKDITSEYVNGLETVKISQKTKVFDHLFGIVLKKLDQTKIEYYMRRQIYSILISIEIYVLQIIYAISSRSLGYEFVKLSMIAIISGILNQFGNPIQALLSQMKAIHESRDVYKKLSAFLKKNASKVVNEK